MSDRSAEYAECAHVTVLVWDRNFLSWKSRKLSMVVGSESFRRGCILVAAVAGLRPSYASSVRCIVSKSGVYVWWNQGVPQVFLGLLSVARREEGSFF